MKRYRLVKSAQSRSSERADSYMTVDPKGDWVLYSDIAKEPKRLDAERVILIRKITHLLNLGGYLYDGEEILFEEVLAYLRGESNDRP